MPASASIPFTASPSTLLDDEAFGGVALDEAALYEAALDEAALYEAALVGALLAAAVVPVVVRDADARLERGAAAS